MKKSFLILSIIGSFLLVSCAHKGAVKSETKRGVASRFNQEYCTVESDRYNYYIVMNEQKEKRSQVFSKQTDAMEALEDRRKRGLCAPTSRVRCQIVDEWRSSHRRKGIYVIIDENDEVRSKSFWKQDRAMAFLEKMRRLGTCN